MYLPEPADLVHASPVYAPPTISVIEAEKESYSEYHERKKREEGRKRVPFGFGRVLEES
jgi:hypothetical protein